MCFTHIILFVHVRDLLAFQFALREAGLLISGIEIWTHRIPNFADGQPPMGEIRYRSMNRLQREMGKNDWAILADDDLNWVSFWRGEMGINRKTGKPTPRYKYCLDPNQRGYQSPANSQEFHSRLARLAARARRYYYYFTTSSSGRANSGFKPDSPMQPVGSWSGLFGFFKQSPNPFDCTKGVGADLWAWCFSAENDRLVYRKFTMVTYFSIVKEKYQVGGPREKSMLELRERYERIVWWVDKQTGTGTQMGFPRLRNNVKKDILMRLGIPENFGGPPMEKISV